MSQTLHHPSLRELIAGDLRRRILAKEIQPGERLDIAGIAARFDVSPGSVREAALALETDGLVVVNPRRGITVRVVTAGDLLEIYQVREVIDVAAARLVARSEDDAGLAALRAAQSRIEWSWAEGGFAAGLAADLDFHVLLCALSGNSRLESISQVLVDQTVLHLRPVEEVDSSIRSRPPADLHAAILDAIAAGDDDAIQRACADHYAFSRMRVTPESHG